MSEPSEAGQDAVDGIRPAAFRSTGAASGPPKVSVMIITYNHERYIAQALDSVLMQETNFAFEINVIEDCSTDSTAKIIRSYVAKHPNIVKPYLNTKNIGYKVTQKNFTRGFRTLKGQYIAILEGDDYWSSPLKLQKQVDFLDNNLDFAICAHNTIKMYDNGSQEAHRFLYHGNQGDGTIDDVISLRMFFHTTGVLYRNVFNGVPPRHYISPWSCDIFIMISHAEFGKVHHMDEDLAVYRAHAGGRFSTMSILKGWSFNIGSLQRYNAWLGYRFAKPFARSIIKYCGVILSETGQNGIPKLKWWQRLHYEFIRFRYQAFLCVVETPVRLHRLKLLEEQKTSRKAIPETLHHGSKNEILSSQFHSRSVGQAFLTMILRVAFPVLGRFSTMDISPTRLPTIASFGPESAEHGKHFNVQADGQSAIWMLVSAPPPPQTIVVFGGVGLRTLVSDRVVTAAVPVRLTERAGLIPVWLEAEMTDCIQVSDPVYFESKQTTRDLSAIEACSL